MMRLQAIEKEAVSLPEEDRAALAAVLLSSLEGPVYDVDDHKVKCRDEEMETGRESGISHEQLRRAVRAPRAE